MKIKTKFKINPYHALDYALIFASASCLAYVVGAYIIDISGFIAGGAAVMVYRHYEKKARK